MGISARRGGSFTLVALGLLAELAAATLFASGGTARFWRRIRRL